MSTTSKWMRFLVVSVACIVSSVLPRPAMAQTVLTDKMATFNYFVGTWSCVFAVPSVGDQPAKTLNSTETYETMPGNVLHVHSFDNTGGSNDFYGYDSNSQVYWHSGIDSLGRVQYGRSSDGVIFMGDLWSKYLAVHVPVRSEVTRVSDNEHTRHVILGDQPGHTIDADCKRSP